VTVLNLVNAHNIAFKGPGCWCYLLNDLEWTFLLTYFQGVRKKMDDIVVFIFCLCDCVNFVFENVRHFR